MEVQIKDLEAKLNYVDLVEYLCNEVVVPTDKKTIVYVGEAIDLYFEDMAIKGRARLSKYERTKGTKNKIKPTQWFPPKFQTQEVPFVKDKRIWRINSSEYHNSYYFLSDGKLQTEYRDALKEMAENQRLGLSHKLFEMVFGPIDSEIMEIYKQVKRLEF